MTKLLILLQGESEKSGATIAMLAPEPFCFEILDSKQLLTTKEVKNPLIGMKQSVLLPLSLGDTVIVWVTADVICRRVTGCLEFQNVN